MATRAAHLLSFEEQQPERDEASSWVRAQSLRWHAANLCDAGDPPASGTDAGPPAAAAAELRVRWTRRSRRESSISSCAPGRAPSSPSPATGNSMVMKSLHESCIFSGEGKRAARCVCVCVCVCVCDSERERVCV
jgi:hypothetical protein